VSEWRVIIETRAPGGGPPSREAFEITPPPAPGTERDVLAQLVAGIHPGAVERGHAGGRSVFDDGGRRIVAMFEAGGAPPAPAGPAQETLFDA
jgi:hypothetical protein